MKYEIIFKNGQIKNVVSKDVNKVKNYITESFNKISSVKRLDESKNIGEQKLISLASKYDEDVQYKSFSTFYRKGIGCLAYATNTNYDISTCVNLFVKVLRKYKDSIDLLDGFYTVYFASRDYFNGYPEYVWGDAKDCVRNHPNDWNVYFVVKDKKLESLKTKRIEPDELVVKEIKRIPAPKTLEQVLPYLKDINDKCSDVYVDLDEEPIYNIIEKNVVDFVDKKHYYIISNLAMNSGDSKKSIMKEYELSEDEYNTISQIANFLDNNGIIG